jgi:hypothetical protein
MDQFYTHTHTHTYIYIYIYIYIQTHVHRDTYCEFYDIHNIQDYNFNLFENSFVLDISLFTVKFPDGDLEKIETCRIISGFYVTVYILILTHLLLLSMKLFISAMK